MHIFYNISVILESVVIPMLIFRNDLIDKIIVYTNSIVIHKRSIVKNALPV